MYDVRISDSLYEQAKEAAHAQHITLDRYVEAALQSRVEADLGSLPQNKPANEIGAPKHSYASFFGIAKGRPGAHGSPEAADRYIDELRDAW